MAEKIVSPGVFTQERDLSFLPQGVAEIGAVFVGPTIKGPVLKPTQISSFNEFIQKFGPLTEKSYLPYAVQAYLKDAPNATIVRLAPTSSTAASIDYTYFTLHTLSEGSVSNYELKAEVFATRSAGEVPGSKFGDFSIRIRRQDTTDNGTGATYFGSNIEDTPARPNIVEQFYNCNLDPTSPNFVARVIGDRYAELDVTGSTARLKYSGDYPNKSAYVRVSIPQQTLDTLSELTEGFANYNLPIGVSTFDGGTGGGGITGVLDGTNLVYRTATSSSSTTFTPTITTGSLVVSGSIPTYLTTSPYTGYINSITAISFSGASVSNSPLLSGSTRVGVISGNSIISSSFTVATGTGTITFLTASGQTTYKFTSGSVLSGTNLHIIFYTSSINTGPGGNNDIKTGKDIVATNTQGLNCSSTTSTGTVLYKTAFEILSNQDEFDMNMIVTPGVIYGTHTNVNDLAKDLCEDRGDTFYVMDGGTINSSVTNVVSNVRNLDTNYVATYHPWVKILDVDKNKPIWVPPSVVLPGVIAFNDQVAAEWYAPAGLNRGGLPNVIDVKTRLTHAERDDLYVGRVNPIATFPSQGATVFGQKTLQARPSALDRINVRRLLIAVKKFIASSSRYLVFEQNTAATRNRFLSIVNPYLESIQQRNGLYAFRVVMDDTNNTVDMIDRNMLKGDIFLQPTRTAEFIVLDFTVLPTGAVFPE